MRVCFTRDIFFCFIREKEQIDCVLRPALKSPYTTMNKNKKKS